MKKIQLSKSSKGVIKKLKKLKNSDLIKEIHTLSSVEARIEFAKIRNYFASKKKIEVGTIKDFKINKIPIRYYRAKNNSPKDILPVMIYFHGGGWVLGNLDTHDQVCRKLIANSKYDILSVDYSLAPEASFPKAIEESREVLKTISQSDLGLKIDNSKIIVCGDSAGGNIATVLCDYNKRILKSNILLQVLIYPATHMFSSYDSKDKYDGLILNKKLMKWFQDNYVPRKIRKKYYDDIRLSPIKNKNLKGLPDTLIVLAECDPLYDEGFLYGKKLDENQVKVEIKTYKGLMHGFLTMSGAIEEVDIVIKDINKKIKSYL